MTRQEQILKLIVEHFIKTAEPVGSKTLKEVFNLDVSTATIRNEMNELEKEGFLEKPFVSSGRVPSKKGYDYYVDHLRSEEVNSQAKNALSLVLQRKDQSVEKVLQEACRILSDMTKLTSVVTGDSEEDEERLASVQLVPLVNNTGTAIIVTSKGYVEHQTIVIPSKVDVQEVVDTIKLLNDRLTGVPIRELAERMDALRPVLKDYMVGQEVIFDAVLSAFTKFAVERVAFYGGKEEIFNQPEFQNDVEQLKEMVALLDNPEKLKRILSKTKVLGDSGVRVLIGNKDDGSKANFALVTTDLNLPNTKGQLTLVGPSRMDYTQVVSTLKYFAGALDEYFDGKPSEKGDKDSCSRKEMTKKKAKKSSKKNPKE